MIVPLAVAAALLIGGSVAAWKFWPATTTAGPQAESSTIAAESPAPDTAESSPSPSETAPTASGAAAEALEACQAKVKAADEVRKQGKIGVLHWADHVDAQADYFDGEITSDELKARFKKTRVKGPGDLKRYNEALSTYEELEGSCAKVEGADSAVAASLKTCSQRSKAQRPVLEATADGMKDWQGHIKQMQANAEHQAGSPSEAQAAWLEQYRAAPKNIAAFKKATKNFDAPSC